MICYKDQSWCLEHECKHKDTCFRYFTDEHKEKAKAVGLDACFSNFREHCFEERER